MKKHLMRKAVGNRMGWIEWGNERLRKVALEDEEGEDGGSKRKTA